MDATESAVSFRALAADIKRWGAELGFQKVGITDTDLTRYAPDVRRWVAEGLHGGMHYMARGLPLRLDPSLLFPETIRVIVARMNYAAPGTEPETVLADPTRGYVSRYALGRDYHKVVRGRLRRLADRINQAVGHGRFRAFADSAPVLEKPLAEKAGLGWRGKHTLLLDREGSWFFLGELYTNLPLPIDDRPPPERSVADGSVSAHSARGNSLTDDRPAHDGCGACRACIRVCPTGAIVGPRRLDARRCISYLTIEHREGIPPELRRAIGNRIFGCDDCQLICPWNRFAAPSAERDFTPRHGLEGAPLLDLFAWSEATFLSRTEGSALRRIDYRQWQRNLAVALGNAPWSEAILAALRARRNAIGASDAMLTEHIEWALAEQLSKRPGSPRDQGTGSAAA